VFLVFQSCFVDEIITDALSIVYEAGCRATDVSPLSKHKKSYKSH